VAVQALLDAVLKVVVLLIMLVVGLVLVTVRVPVAVRHCASALDVLVVSEAANDRDSGTMRTGRRSAGGTADHRKFAENTGDSKGWDDYR
jgi:hypothetical protein